MGVLEHLGNSVRRPAGPWTPAVHALLRHLEAVGFDGAPCVLGCDADGVELLSYVAGEVPHAPLPSWARTDTALRSVARLIRRYHDAVRSFTPPPDAQWQATSSPTAGNLVCHNDLYPGNVVFRGGRAVGLIDFDFAHPAPPLWEVAMAAWHWIPLMPPADGGPATVARAGQRLRAFCVAYGLALPDRSQMLGVVTQFLETAATRLEAARRAGVPAAVQHAEVGVGERLHRSRQWLLAHQPELAAALEPSLHRRA